MASSRGNVHSDTAKKEQIITEFFTKTLQIILESRSPYMSSRHYSGEQVVSSPSSSSSSSSSFRTRDKWFNLALRECPAALENIDFWRQSNLEPMVVDVILVQRDFVNFSPQRDFVKNPTLKDQVSNFMNLEPDEPAVVPRNEKIIERWVVQYESRKSRDGGLGSKKSSGNLHSLYKKSIVLLRSLYVTIRLLPAYKLFRDLISSGQIHTYTLTHRVSTFVEPFTRKEESEMQRFSFAPVDTSCGKLCLSVSYRSILSDVSSEPSTPMSPQFIPDYVGSPLADPLKRFPSLPRSHGSPSYSPFSRRHSWSYENYQASPLLNLPSPSPTYSDSHASVSKCKSRIPPPLSLPQRLPETFQATGKNTGYDEYWPSPVFSPSPSPSPPMYIANTDGSKALLRCESAPVRIPVSNAFNRQILRPSPPPKLTRATTLKSDRSTGPSGSSVEKFSLGRDESGRYSGPRVSTNSSPGISFSRSSSRPSIHDDFDDTEFACPFVVDDDDMGSRPGSFDQKGKTNDPLEPGGSAPVRKSQDAKVGALVLMLKKAPPLRQDSLMASKAVSWRDNEEPALKPDDQQSQKGTCTSILSSSLATSRTTADALEELRSYKDLKELLLSQGKSSRKFCDSAEGASGGKS
ncbi:autophagy-related protein 13b-like [Chenopodium quinoa]|uniref:autophagy-related protein 13b-like n=1 Tax=Chenopodium quinoa TaxID=63459 RepID=UPI000B76DA9A|nr:autophagy-related protein 13b-like [Chenopodium quinoa]